MTAAAPIPWYFDVISPYAWLAYHRLGEIEQHQPVVLRPVVFGAILKHWGQLGPAEIAPKRIHTYRQFAYLAGKMGIPYRFPAAHPFRSLDVLRLIVALGETPLATRLAFEAVWGLGEDTTQPDVLRRIAKAAGDESAFDRINDEKTKQKLAANTAEAIAAGAFGVPTLIINGEVFWGLDAMDMALDALRNPHLLSQGEMGRAMELTVGVRRVR